MKIKINKETVFNIIVFSIFIAITSYVSLHHEMWSDEAQAWLISRDLSLIDIFKEMKYEGHSMLWNLILIPFIKLGFPYEYINLISCVIIYISVYMILFKIKINKIIKLLIIFSEPYMYFYTSIARCYCLIPLLINMIIILEENKKKNIYSHAIVLALLANVHAIMVPIVIIITLVNYIPNIRKSSEYKRKYIYSLCIVTIGIFLFLIQIINLKSSIISEKISSMEYNDINLILVKVLNILKNICFYYVPNNIAVIIFLMIIILAIISLKYYPKQFIICFGSLFSIIFINCIVTLCSNIQRAQVMLIIMFYIAVNICRNSNEFIPKYINRIAFLIYVIVCVGSIIDVVPTIKNEIIKKYSCAEETMEYINNNYSEIRNICCFTNFLMSTSLVPYAKSEYTFYDLVNNRVFTYYHWDKTQEEYFDIRMHEIVQRLENQLYDVDKVLLIVSKDMNYLIDFINIKLNINLIYTSDKSFSIRINFKEEYFVYEVSKY